MTPAEILERAERTQAEHRAWDERRREAEASIEAEMQLMHFRLQQESWRMGNAMLYLLNPNATPEGFAAILATEPLP